MPTIAPAAMHHDNTVLLDDPTLMHLIVQGDSEAFTALYARYTPSLSRFLKRYLQQPEQVEEVVNDAMLAMWQQCADYDPAMSLSSWLFGIARYKALTVRRRAAPSTAGIALDDETQDPGPEDDVARSQQCDRVRQAVQTLPQVLRTVVQLAYNHHYSYQEIATQLKCPVNTIKDRMRQARRRLQPVLAEPDVLAPARVPHHTAGLTTRLDR